MVSRTGNFLIVSPAKDDLSSREVLSRKRWGRGEGAGSGRRNFFTHGNFSMYPTVRLNYEITLRFLELSSNKCSIINDAY